MCPVHTTNTTWNLRQEMFDKCHFLCSSAYIILKHIDLLKNYVNDMFSHDIMLSPIPLNSSICYSPLQSGQHFLLSAAFSTSRGIFIWGLLGDRSTDLGTIVSFQVLVGELESNGCRLPLLRRSRKYQTNMQCGKCSSYLFHSTQKTNEQANKEKPKQSCMVKNTETENNHPQPRVGKQAT
jgi:hypothetical protein